MPVKLHVNGKGFSSDCWRQAKRERVKSEWIIKKLKSALEILLKLTYSLSHSFSWQKLTECMEALLWKRDSGWPKCPRGLARCVPDHHPPELQQHTVQQRHYLNEAQPSRQFHQLHQTYLPGKQLQPIPQRYLLLGHWLGRHQEGWWGSFIMLSKSIFVSHKSVKI